MFQSDDPLAIPLWINGHAFLTITPAFLDVCNPADGEVLRRTPLCGTREALEAIKAAKAALTPWAVLPASTRATLLTALGKALADYADHFVKLIAEESGKDATQAEIEVTEAIYLFCKAVADTDSGGVMGIVGDARMPLLGSLRLAVPALMGGAVVIIRPSPDTPSALFALAELTGRCGFPGGVFNILHGEEEVIDGLRHAGNIRLLYS